MKVDIDSIKNIDELLMLHSFAGYCKDSDELKLHIENRMLEVATGIVDKMQIALSFSSNNPAAAGLHRDIIDYCFKNQNFNFILMTAIRDYCLSAGSDDEWLSSLIQKDIDKFDNPSQIITLAGSVASKKILGNEKLAASLYSRAEERIKSVADFCQMADSVRLYLEDLSWSFRLFSKAREALLLSPSPEDHVLLARALVSAGLEKNEEFSRLVEDVPLQELIR